VLYEMVTGRRAFEGDSQVSLIGNIMNAEPAGLATLQPLTPPALERVVRKCLAKHPDDRWDTAHDVADELRWIRETSGDGVVTPVPPRPRRGSSSRASSMPRPSRRMGGSWPRREAERTS
jgi:serine/threonine protein kinase